MLYLRTKPVVFLFGWLGSAERHVQKYVDVYESIGSKVFVIRPTIAETALPKVGEKSIAQLIRFRFQPVLEQFRKKTDNEGHVGIHHDSYNDSRPIFMHCMSNAGWVAMGTMFYMEDQLATEAKSMTTGVDEEWLTDELRSVDTWEWVKRNMAGIVLDSSPSLATPSIYAKGLASAVLQTTSQDVEHRHPWALSVANSLSQRYFDSPEVLKRFRKVRDAWSHSIPRVPQLYLYSSADPLIPSSHVESFMAQQQAIGSPIIYQRWDDSGHCEHLKKHPMQYRKIVQSFVQRCIAEEDTAENWV